MAITLKKTGYFKEVTANAKYVLSNADWIKYKDANPSIVYGEGLTLGINITGAGSLVLQPSIEYDTMEGEYFYPNVGTTVTKLGYTFDTTGLKFISVYLPQRWKNFYINLPTATANAEIDFTIEERA